jgi:hypothetical protein
MNKKERKKLNRVKAIRKMKNINSMKKIKNAVPKVSKVFHKAFVEFDFIKIAKMKCEDELMSAMKNCDLKTIEELIPIKKMLETAKLEVKDNIAVISSDDFADITINAEDNLVSQNDQVYQFDFAA